MMPTFDIHKTRVWTIWNLNVRRKSLLSDMMRLGIHFEHVTSVHQCLQNKLFDSYLAYRPYINWICNTLTTQIRFFVGCLSLTITSIWKNLCIWYIIKDRKPTAFARYITKEQMLSLNIFKYSFTSSVIMGYTNFNIYSCIFSNAEEDLSAFTVCIDEFPFIAVTCDLFTIYTANFHLQANSTTY